MRSALWTFATLSTLTLALASPAVARHGPHGRGAGDEQRFDRGGPLFDPEALAERFDERADRIDALLDLTDDQRAAFDRKRAEAFEDARPKVERMRSVGEELRELLDSGTTDAAQVGSRVIEMHRLKAELKATRETVESELVEILTEEQRFAFEALKEARHDLEERGARRFGHGARQFGAERRSR
jgi:Spy/CpxP family protein refolding chaperone